jgi:hypothetical protein
MKTQTCILSVIGAAVTGMLVLSSPAIAQQKTVKACEQEWQANKAANQAKGITEKAYVTKCRADSSAAKKPTPAAAKSAEKEKSAKTKKTEKTTKTEKASAAAGGQQKTVKACEAEWRANKAANQAKGIPDKAYVEKCRSGASAATTTAAPVAPSAAKEKTAPATTAARTAQPGPSTGKPAGANQYVAEGQAKSHCPRDTVVWANLDSKIFHFAGHGDYGHTKSGAYMCEKDATGQGMRAAKNEKHP